MVEFSRSYFYIVFPAQIDTDRPVHRPVQPFHGRTGGPCGPRAPVQKRLGVGYGFSLEVPRPHLGSLDDPRVRWPLP